jgi:hypothetical protein
VIEKRTLLFACDGCGAQHEVVVVFGEADRIPGAWMVDMSHRYHACSTVCAKNCEGLRKITDPKAKKLLWLTFKEAEL